MPIRRLSASPSPASFSTPPPATRYRGMADSTNQSFASYDAGSPARGGESGIGEGKVIAALVGRLVNKLPCNSGTRLSIMEVDTGVKATLDSLLQMSRIRLSLVVQALVGALDTLSKYSAGISAHEAPLETLHSQLYLLYVLQKCLSTSWRQYAEGNAPITSQLPQCWPDPPAFEENLARYILSIISIYTRTVSADIISVPGTSSPAPSRDKAGTGSSTSWSSHLSPGSASNAFGIRFLQEHSSSSSKSVLDDDIEELLSSVCLTTSSAISQISQQLARIVFHLSSSNWQHVMFKLKTRIAHLTTTIEEHPDLLDLRLLEWSNLDHSRLSQVLQELSVSFLHIKRPAQVAIAQTFRKAIWNWIEVHPGEFNNLVEANRKMDGGADTLFDVLYSASDITSTTHSRRTRAFYPLMAMLLVICPDLFKRAAMGDIGGRSGGGLSKKLNFLESLRKGLGSPKGYEACAVSYVDFALAASYISPKSGPSGVKMIVQDVQNELKTALFQSSLSSEIGDLDVFVDGLVGLYHADPSGTISLMLSHMMGDGKETQSTIAIRACAQISLLSTRIPWQTTIVDLRDRVAAAIRTILKNQISSLLLDWSAPKRPRASPDLPSSHCDLIVEILNLYMTDVQFALVALAQGSDSLASLLLAISSMTISPSPERLRAQSSKTAVALLKKLSTESESSVTGAGGAIWQLFLDAGRQGLFAMQSDHDDIAQTFNAFRDVATAIALFSHKHPDILAASPKGESASLVGLVAVLSVLISPDFEQLAHTVPCLTALTTLTLTAHKTYLPGVSPDGTNFGSPEKRIMMRTKLLDTLSSLPPAIGRQQQQRQFRKVYQPFSVPTTAGIAIWLGLASVAKMYTGRIKATEATSTNKDQKRRGLAPEIDGLTEGQSKLWQNVVLFLASTATICKYDSAPPPPLVEYVGKGLLPLAYEDPPGADVACDEFIRESVDLLVSGSVHVRETIKEALGSELSPSLSSVMIDQMTKILSHSVGSSGIATSDTFSTFVDQVLAVLRSTIDRASAAESASPTQVDLRGLISLLLRYINRLGRDESSSRIKIRFCQLIEVLLAKRDRVILDGEVQLRNSTLDALTEWSSASQRDVDAFDKLNKVHRDLSHAALKAMVSVTDGLVLRAVGEGQDSVQPAVKSRLFYRIYDHLIKMLEKSQGLENESIKASSFTPSGLKAGPDDITGLAISALSNLLAGNIDVGLKHCLTLGYHEEPVLRTAFMRLMTNILKQGTRFGGLTSRRATSSAKLYTEMLAGDSSNLALAVAIAETCPSNEVDEMSSLLFRLFEQKGSILALVKLLAEREIALTNHESELFRANNFTTKIIGLYARTYGYNYIRATLQPLIHSLVEKPAECSFELDPSKAAPTDDIERNADHLQLMCQALLDLICASTSRVPIMFKAFCHHLWEVTEDRFPDSRHSVIGSFLFLRFFCPAIVAPEGIDLDVSPDTKEVRRALLLITKVIQNLANNVVFGNKEPHMKVLNTFLSENIRQVTNFLLDLSARPKSSDLGAAIQRFQDDAEKLSDPEGDEALLHRFIHKYNAKIDASLLTLPSTYRSKQSSGKATKVDLDGAAISQRLKSLTDATGPPSDPSTFTASARSQAYDDFMRHNAGRNTASVENAFYEGPASQNGRRIFYFIVSRVGLLDYNLLAYHVFQILDHITDFFDLVIDLTDFSASTELPMTWLKRSIQMCPPGILPCINTLAFYNPNTYARRRIRRIIADLLTVAPAPSVGKTVIAASSPAELAEFITFSSLALPEYAMALAYEAEHVFTNLLMLSDHEQQIPVVVKLGHDCMQIASWRKQDLTGNVKSYIIDVIQLKDIDDILASGGLPGDHLVVKHSQNEAITFISKKRNEMAQIVRAARSRLRDGPSDDRTIRPSDVPGTLLNVALLNLSANDESLRLGAYNLINELSQFFKYDLVSGALKVSAGLNIPNNSLNFVQNLSSALAKSAPHLTLELLKEWTIGFNRGDLAQKTAGLHYVGPWILNLELFAKPSRDEGMQAVKQVEEIVRALISATVSERRRLHLLMQKQIWQLLASGHDTLTDLVVKELLSTAVDAGLGSERAECAADILVSLASTAVRGRVIAKLRKTIAQTYLKPTTNLLDSPAWEEIAILSRMTMMLTFNPQSSLDVQLFLPELFHIVTLLLGAGPVLVRQTIYGIAVNMVQSLAATTTPGEMDAQALQQLLVRLQTPSLVSAFGLVADSTSFELIGLPPAHGSEEHFLQAIDRVTSFLADLLVAGSVSDDCANAWRARWMGLVAATCFQHNPATQPQAFTVLGHLATDEVDDDLVYQILVAMSTILAHFTESDNVLLISMLRCLSKIIPGLLPESRYPGSLFWLAIGVLQLNYIPPFSAALELLQVTLKCIVALAPTTPLISLLSTTRNSVGEPAGKLDQVSGVSFDNDICFSLVGVIFKGLRHPSIRDLAMEVLMEFLPLSAANTLDPDSQGQANGADRSNDSSRRGSKKDLVPEDSVAFFMALLPVVAGQPEELKALFAAANVEIPISVARDLPNLSVLPYLNLPDNSSALLLITLVVTILNNTVGSESEKIVLYRFLADASVEMPEVVAMAYDSLIPRMTAVLATTTTVPIITSITTILNKAMVDPAYSFPQSHLPTSESHTSLHHRSQSGSVSSHPSIGAGAREQLLEDMGMRGLSELTFVNVKMDRITPTAKWVAALIDSFTV